MMDRGSNETFEMGRVISRTFSVYGRNFVTFTLLSALAAVPYFLLNYYFVKINPSSGIIASGITGHTSATFVLLWTWGRIALLTAVWVSFAFILQAAIIHGTLTDLNGNSATFGNSLSTGIKVLLPLIGLALLTLLGCAAATLLLIVPGIMLYMAWFVVVPVFVVEHSGILEAFRRSRELTRGFRWPIFGLAFIYGIAVDVISFALAPLFSVSLFHPGAAMLTIPYLLASTAVRVLTAVVFATGVASIYYELRMVKEGIGPQALAAAFD